MNDWIQSLGGRKVTPRALQRDQVGNLYEVATVLSRRNRFSGATRRPYSVAEHCVLGSEHLPAAFAGAFLLHELSEVYLPDVPAPLKPFLFVDLPSPIPGVAPLAMHGAEADGVPWSELERRHTRTILEAWDLLSLEPLIYSREVRSMDLRMLVTEKRDLMGPEPEPWGFDDVVPLDAKIERASRAPEQVAGDFINAFGRFFK